MIVVGGVGVEEDTGGTSLVGAALLTVDARLPFMLLC